MCGHPSERQGSSASEQLWVGIIIFSKKLSVLVRRYTQECQSGSFRIEKVLLVPFALPCFVSQ